MRPVPTISAVLAVALGLSACGGPGAASTGGAPVAGGTFTLAVDGDPGALDPHFTDLSNTLQIDEFLYDSLLSVDPAGQLLPHLAQEWEATGTTATFTLRPGITCSDGTPLTAGTVASNIGFAGDPANAAAALGLYVPPGATATADDATGTVTVTSPTPDAFLDRNVGGLPIVCERGLADRGLLAQGAEGTGMYTVGEVVPGDRFVLTRRADYAWAPGGAAGLPGQPDTVVVRVIPNETTVANLLASGELSVAAVDGPDRQRLEAQGLFRRDVLSMVGQLWFNQRDGAPAADATVRRALVQALDLAELTRVVTSGTGQPAASLVVPTFSPCKEDTVAANLPAPDVAGAAAALDAAGWVAGPDGARQRDGAPLALTVFFQTSNGPAEQAAGELVAERWRALGVEVTTRAATDAEISQVVFAGGGAWDVAFAPLNATLPSQLVPFFAGPTAPDGNNFAAVDNGDYAAAVAEAAALPGPEGCGRWAAAEAALVRDADTVPFAYSSVPYFGRDTTFEVGENGVLPGTIQVMG